MIHGATNSRMETAAYIGANHRRLFVYVYAQRVAYVAWLFLSDDIK